MKFMGNQLSNNNSNITDLSDKNRLTKLGERYKELYDNQWTDAYEIVETNIGKEYEQDCVGVLIKLLMAAKEFCEMEVKSQDKLLKEALLLNGKHKEMPDHVIKQLKDCRKEMASENVATLFKLSRRGKLTHHLKDYVKECIELCWLWSLQDPPLVFGPNASYRSPLDLNVYRSFTQSGKYIDFVVWPPVYLHEGGPILAKGVAQGMRDSMSTSDCQTDRQKDKQRAKSYHGTKSSIERDNIRSRRYTPETKVYENIFSDDLSSNVTNSRNYQQQTQPTSTFTSASKYTRNIPLTQRELDKFYHYMKQLGEAGARAIMGDRFDVCVMYLQQHRNNESSP